MSFELYKSSYRSRVSSYKKRVSSYKGRVSSNKKRVSSYEHTMCLSNLQGTQVKETG